jgi:hypothetical protein
MVALDNLVVTTALPVISATRVRRCRGWKRRLGDRRAGAAGPRRRVGDAAQLDDRVQGGGAAAPRSGPGRVVSGLAVASGPLVGGAHRPPGPQGRPAHGGDGPATRAGLRLIRETQPAQCGVSPMASNSARQAGPTTSRRCRRSGVASFTNVRRPDDPHHARPSWIRDHAHPGRHPPGTGSMDVAWLAVGAQRRRGSGDVLFGVEGVEDHAQAVAVIRASTGLGLRTVYAVRIVLTAPAR